MNKYHLVRYVPKKFGSPAWMRLSEAERLLKEDSQLIGDLIECGAATEKDFPEIQFPKNK